MSFRRIVVPVFIFLATVLLIFATVEFVFEIRRENVRYFTGHTPTPLSSTTTPVPEISRGKEPNISPEAGVRATITQTVNKKTTAKVTRVIDGDTFEIEGGKKVRMIGVDTPETVDPHRKDGCYGREAATKTKELLSGVIVELEKDVSDTDRYGRFLRYVYKDGVFINELMVREGYAIISTYPPDIKYVEMFRQAETSARESNKGLWAVCAIQ